jgi:hypothetical protein
MNYVCKGKHFLHIRSNPSENFTLYYYILQIARIYLRILTLFTHKNRPLFQETY